MEWRYSWGPNTIVSQSEVKVTVSSSMSLPALISFISHSKPGKLLKTVNNYLHNPQNLLTVHQLQAIHGRVRWSSTVTASCVPPPHHGKLTEPLVMHSSQLGAPLSIITPSGLVTKKRRRCEALWHRSADSAPHQ
jgi:hypothetical protein